MRIADAADYTAGNSTERRVAGGAIFEFAAWPDAAVIAIRMRGVSIPAP
jgi:hypothetical protein